MLVLTRNEGQTILIGDNVRLTVVGTKGGQVRFGIEAPRDLTILREELVDKASQDEPGAAPSEQDGQA